MASTGNVFPTSGTTVDRAGATAWTNPGNVTLDDAADATAAVPTDYLVCTTFGFTIPDVWVVGYGLDYADRYRTLPYIAELKASVYRK